MSLFNEQPKYSLSEFEFLQDPMDRNSKLGVGSFASVKLAKEKRTGNLFAMKMVRIQNNKQVNAELYNIKCEIFIHRKLEHPNIIKFHDYVHQDPNVYLILDYAENGNLYSYIHKKKQLKENEIFRYFYQSCLAVQYMHQNDVFHRDIKPENLLLDTEYNIKLCDFGWATQRIQDKRTTFCGTYEYMAPEIVYKRPYDYRVDIWSLGVLLYELFHRESPYKGRTMPEICRSLSKGTIKFSSNCHSDAQDLIQRILKHNPTERLSLPQIFTHPWVLSHLSKEENARLRPSPMPLRSLSQCNNVRPATPIEAPERWNKEKYDAQTTTNAQTNKTQPYDTWSEYFVTSQNQGHHRHMKSHHEINRSHMIYTDVSPQRVLQTSRSNVNLHLDIKQHVVHQYEAQSALPDTGRTKSGSSSSSANVLGNQTPYTNNHHTPQKSSEEKKGFFQTNIFSPSFKSKLTSLISQLTLKTPTDQATQRTETGPTLNQHTPQNSSFTYNTYNTQSISSYCQASSFILDDKDSHSRKESLCFKSGDKVSYNGGGDSFSQNTFRSNLQGRSPKVLDHMKNTFKERLGPPKGDSLPIDPSSNSSTRTNTSDICYGSDILDSTQRARDAINNEKIFIKTEKEPVVPLVQRNNNEKYESIRSRQKEQKEQKEKSQFVNKKTMELKNILGANIVRYQIPIPVSTTNRQGRGKENFLWN